MDITYSLLDDRPELVLADIDRLQPSHTIANNDGFGQGTNANSSEQTAPAAPAGLTAPPIPTGEFATNSGQYQPAPPTLTQSPAVPLPIGVPNVGTAVRNALLKSSARKKSPLRLRRPRPAIRSCSAKTPAAPSRESAARSCMLPDSRPRNCSSGDDSFCVKDIATKLTRASWKHITPRSRWIATVPANCRNTCASLAPARNRNIRQVGAQVPSRGNADADMVPGSKLEIADQQRTIKFEKLRTEVLNAHFKAERLRDSEPDKALEILNGAVANVERSDLGKDAVAPLLNLLSRSRTEIETQQKQRAPIVAQGQRNKDVLIQIDKEQQYRVRVEQEFADLVEEYNKLVHQNRWAEAEMIAKQAKELDRDNPTATVMFEKARIGRQEARIVDLKERKADAFIEQLWEVEDAAATGIYGKEYKFPKDWADITGRRKGKYGPDNKERSEPEKQIEQSLGRQVSLHFDNVPLEKVIEHVRNIADVNVVLDSVGLEEEKVATSTPISIGVDGITLRSALNLILEPLNLGYMVDNEVLKITSRLRAAGQAELRTYPVADLVLPIPNAASQAVNLQPGTGGLQFSVADNVPGASGQAFMQNLQVGDRVGANPNVGIPGMGNGTSTTINAPRPDFDSIQHLIVSTIEPESWSEVGGQAQISHFDTTLSLVIRQTQKVHDEIRELLQQLRRLQDLQVTIECRFITVDDDFFENVGVDFNFNLPSSVNGPATLGTGAFGYPIVGTSSTSSSSTTSTSSTSSSTSGSTSTSTSTSSTSSTSTSFAPFLSFPFSLNLPNKGSWPSQGTIVGMDTETSFSPDLNVPFRQGSFDVGIPQFGGYNPAAGMTVGMAILSDIESFFFIRAVQGDTRTNVMFAPKVTLFNGQQAIVQDTVTQPFVVSVQPTVGVFAVGLMPIIENIPSGVTMTVAAVVSADRRFVRLSVVPRFIAITQVFTFTFLAAPGQTGGTGGTSTTGGTSSTSSSGFGGGLSGSSGVGGIGGGPIPMSMKGVSSDSGVGLMSGTVGFGGISGTSSTSSTTTNNSTSTTSAAVGNITIQQPVFETVQVLTTVSVPDGGTVLLGGVKRLREGRTMSGVPILNQIPYISRLFKNTGIGRETESLMLMVTPRIIIQEEEEELLESTPTQQ